MFDYNITIFIVDNLPAFFTLNNAKTTPTFDLVIK